MNKLSKEYKVNNLKKTKKNGIYELTIDDEKLEVSEDLIVKYTLINNKILNDREYQNLQLDIKNEIYLRKVYHYLSFQARSSYEVSEYLKELGCKEEVIKSLIDILTTKQFINDDLLAKSLLESVKSSLKGPNEYSLKLKQKHINIKYPYELEEEERIIDEKISKIKNKNCEKPVAKQKQILYEKLIRDGFSIELVSKKLNEIEYIDNSQESLKKDFDKTYQKYKNQTNDKNWKNKLISSLMNKGYAYKDITECLKNIKDDSY